MCYVINRFANRLNKNVYHRAREHRNIRACIRRPLIDDFKTFTILHVIFTYLVLMYHIPQSRIVLWCNVTDVCIQTNTTTLAA